MGPVLFMLIWGIAYPFIYGQGLSRMFGLHKKIDHWILFVLHFSAFFLTAFAGSILDIIFRNGIVTACIMLALKTVYEGAIWQFSMKDRKMNGFLIGLICSLIFYLPVAIAMHFLVNS